LKTPVVIIGAGPAGLSAAYELTNHGIRSLILESSDTVGGIARTVNYKGYLFDVGGHRFFTRVELIEKIWRQVLGEDFLERDRMSRIYYRGRFFHYPLRPLDALLGLGVFESLRCAGSYLRSALRPVRPEDTFEAWVSNRFGRRLYEIFFKTYTEKVWGIPCADIAAEWAAQRIKDLSLRTALWEAVRPSKNHDRSKQIKTLIHRFHYPRRGPGMMWQRFREIVEGKGSRVLLNAPVDKIRWEPGRVVSVTARGREYAAEHLISSMAIRDLIHALDPQPEELEGVAEAFHYRDFLTVAVIVRQREVFPDTWIYIHEPDVLVGRIQNFKNWSPEMVPDPETTCLGMEYFCFEGDHLWCRPDAELIDLAFAELVRLGLVRRDSFLDGAVLRMAKAYPVYDRHYQRGLSAVRAFLRKVPNLQLVGRNGMHRYNNQDHSMLTAILAARNVLGANYDLWKVNVDADYHEQASQIDETDLDRLATTQPLVPQRAGDPGGTPAASEKSFGATGPQNPGA